MAGLPDNIREKLAQLSADFIASVPQRMSQIDEGMGRLLSRNADAGVLSNLHLHVHKLHGSSATFGYQSLSDISGEMEDLIREIDTANPAADTRILDKLQNVYKRLKEEQKQIGIEELETVETENVAIPVTAAAQMKNRRVEGETGLKHLIYIHKDDPHSHTDLMQQLGFFGYTIEEVSSLDVMEDRIQSKSFKLVLIDTEYLQLSDSITSKLAALKREHFSSLSYVFLSSQGDFETRLQAVRAGGDAFFQHPADIGRLIDKIDYLISRNMEDPYHILIVDDDPEQISFHAHVLQQAGMITSVATDARQVVKVLVEAKPEIILMDMYMPGCNGMELAAVIRQQEAFVSIPIVFLSVETNMEKQLAAIRLGGDDFLTKPIQEEHLIASITNRVERTRSMRYLMERDSLTGLLNHSNLKENLNRELKRAERTGSEICFAMIDIDHFKKVNDTYGHLTGDKVLQGLARLLQERLRATDIIGRYGGEEFAVILLNTSLENAKKILDGIRENFSQIKQQAENAEFRVTFSAGIAAYPGYDSAQALNEAADKFLYEAKEGGRNRVEVSDS